MYARRPYQCTAWARLFRHYGEEQWRFCYCRPELRLDYYISIEKLINGQTCRRTCLIEFRVSLKIQPDIPTAGHFTNYYLRFHCARISCGFASIYIYTECAVRKERSVESHSSIAMLLIMKFGLDTANNVSRWLVYLILINLVSKRF